MVKHNSFGQNQNGTSSSDVKGAELYPKCVRCGEPNTTEQYFGKCVVCYDCAEELAQ